MAVAFDANQTSDETLNGVTSITSTKLTIGSGANRALVVQFGFSLATLTMTTGYPRWDDLGTPQATASIGTANSTGTVHRADLWGLVAPTSGNKTLKAAWTGTSDVTMNGVSWTGVDQTGGATSFPHFTSAAGTQASTGVMVGPVTITSATGNATMDQLVNTGTPSAPTQTQTYLDTTPAGFSAGGSRAAGAATVTHSWSQVGGDIWVQVGCDIKAAGAAAAQVPYQPQYVRAPVMAQ